jgi:hypothetical protein
MYSSYLFSTANTDSSFMTLPALLLCALAGGSLNTGLYVFVAFLQKCKKEKEIESLVE